MQDPEAGRPIRRFDREESDCYTSDNINRFLIGNHIKSEVRKMGEANRADLKNACLGIEFGSTNIKAVLIGENNDVLASGSFRWASSFENGYFT